MQSPIDPAEKFVDNWAYLRTELNWLDRVLMLAVARHRKEAKDIDRIAQSRADRVTSHWWKGVISLETEISHDEHGKVAPLSPIAKLSYQQQLEARIRATRQQGIALALPLLCDRLALTVFEKNVILLSLAPEVNRRYARLYRYLQGDELPLKTDLPTVDLALRLLCRNDQEWRAARTRLAATSPLLHHNLLKLLPPAADTLLNQSLQLDRALINYLLADQTTAEALETLIEAPVTSPAPLLTSCRRAIDWSDLVLPPLLLESLQHLTRRYKLAYPHQQWEPHRLSVTQLGAVVLLTGAPGTGKTLAAAAIAHALNTPLVSFDLALLPPASDAQVLAEIAALAPKVLLLQSAHCWFGRCGRLADAAITQLLNQRRSIRAVTLLEARVNHSLRLHWRTQLHSALTLPLPKQPDRLRLWQQAFPPQMPLDPAIDWCLLTQVALSGGEIAAIAQEAAISFAASGESTLTLTHLAQAFVQRGKSLRRL
jgi:hypothetical protein